MGLIPGKLCRFLCFQLALLHWVSYFVFLYQSPSSSPSSSLCMVFGSISSNIDEVLSMKSSANVFVFEDFNVHYKDWLTCSGGTDWPGELCYNFSISSDLTQMVNFNTRIPVCSFGFISSDGSICSTMAFLPSEIKHVDVLGVQSAACLEAFLIKQVVLVLHVSNVLGMCRDKCLLSHASYTEACR